MSKVNVMNFWVQLQGIKSEQHVSPSPIQAVTGHGPVLAGVAMPSNTDKCTAAQRWFAVKEVSSAEKC